MPDLKVKSTSEYKKISLEETFKFLETTSTGLSDTNLTESQLLIVLVASAIFTLGIDFPKYYLFKRFGL